MNGLKQFLLRSSTVDLAVGLVIGTAFTTVITDGVLAGLINPLISAIFGQNQLDQVGEFTLNNAEFSIGVILAAALNFLLIASALYFVVVLPLTKLQERYAEAPVDEESVVLLREIRDALTNRGESSTSDSAAGLAQAAEGSSRNN